MQNSFQWFLPFILPIIIILKNVLYLLLFYTVFVGLLIVLIWCYVGIWCVNCVFWVDCFLCIWSSYLHINVILFSLLDSNLALIFHNFFHSIRIWHKTYKYSNISTHLLTVLVLYSLFEKSLKPIFTNSSLNSLYSCLRVSTNVISIFWGFILIISFVSWYLYVLYSHQFENST